MAFPNQHATKQTMVEEDVRFCTHAEELLRYAMTGYLPLACVGQEKWLYAAPLEINNVLKKKNMSFHASRYATTNANHVLNIHIDSQNPDKDENQLHSIMNMPAVCYSVSDSNRRNSFIGYGRESVVNAVLRVNQYGKCIRDIVDFHNTLSYDNKYITPSIIQQYQSNAITDGHSYHFPVHINKNMTYSAFGIDQIINVLKVNSFGTYQTISILYSTILSESPDLFQDLTKLLLLPNKEWIQLDY